MRILIRTFNRGLRLVLTPVMLNESDDINAWLHRRFGKAI